MSSSLILKFCFWNKVYAEKPLLVLVQLALGSTRIFLSE